MTCNANIVESKKEIKPNKNKTTCLQNGNNLAKQLHVHALTHTCTLISHKRQWRRGSWVKEMHFLLQLANSGFGRDEFDNATVNEFINVI